MSREIKFRAWDDCAGKMVIAGIDDGYTFIKCECGFDVYDNDGMGIHHLELMQYTGIEDKDGDEIYEGDIIKRISMQPFTTELAGNVIMFEGCWYIDGGEDGIPLFNEIDENLVIGNIYENPELLEAE